MIQRDLLIVPKHVYGITDEAFEVIRKYNTSGWESALHTFIESKGRLIEKYRKIRKSTRISLTVGNKTLSFSPGKHNELQVEIVKAFSPSFCPDARLVYVGDAARKMLHVDEELLKNLRIPFTKHDKLPDVVLYDDEKDLLFLIEAVTSHGPISPKRQIELEETLKACKSKKSLYQYFCRFQGIQKAYR